MSAETAYRKLIIDTSESMHELGVRLGEVFNRGDLVILTGPLGAGKTTLSRGIGEGLRVRGPVTSPTFVLARTHPSLADGPPLVHVDAYRLGSAAELDDLDIDFEHSVVLVEWGDGMVDLPEAWLHIVIERPMGAGVGVGAVTDAVSSEQQMHDPAVHESDEPRSVIITGYGERWRGVSF